jgi:tetratricopeptide (TPR) repeat protein
MPKTIFIHAILLFYPTMFLGQISKQPNIQFETEYIDAVDHWVVLPQKKETDSGYLLGYIYLDEIVGFSFTFYGELVIDSDFNWTLRNNSQNLILKSTLDTKTPLLYLVLSDQIEKLNLPEKPQWLKLYDNEVKTAEELVLLGYHYNKVNKSNLALPFLAKAYAINPNAKNLAFEFSFAYNSIGNYENAIIILKEGLLHDAKNFMLYREMGFALIQLHRYEEAENVYELGIRMCESDTQKREMAIDMAQTFFALKDVDRFEKWAAILKK